MQELIIPLITSTRNKNGAKSDSSWMRKILKGQLEAGILDSAMLGISKNGKNITAAILSFPWKDCVYPRYFGCDYDWPQKDFRYFVLSYYAAIDHYATAQKFNRAFFSISALEAKAKRGATISPLVALIAFRKNMLDSNQVRNNNRVNFERYKAIFNHRLSSEWSLMKDYI